MGYNYDDLSELLSNLYDNGNLKNTYLIETNDINYTENALKNFVFCKILKNENNNQESLIHSNYLCLSGESNSNGSILLEQVHKIHHFIYNTSMNGLPKIVIILLPEYMTLNAANASLKLLEDDTILKYVFFISINIKLIPDTIKSRCIKLHHYAKENYFNNKQAYVDHEMTSLLLRDCTKEKQLQFLAKTDNIKSMNWLKFTYTIENTLYRLWRSRFCSEYVLNDNEQCIIKQFSQHNAKYLNAKYQKVMKLIQDANKFNIHLHSIFFLILEEFYQ